MTRAAGDITDDKFFRKANDSDCTQFHIMFPGVSAHCKTNGISLSRMYANPCSLGLYVDHIRGWHLHSVPLSWHRVLQGQTNAFLDSRGCDQYFTALDQ